MYAFLALCSSHLVICSSVLAIGEPTPFRVYVGGQSISRDDIVALINGMFAAHIRQVKKNPAEMPSDAPLIYYAGNGVIWESRRVNQDLGSWSRVNPAWQPAADAFVAAVALAAMDAGKAGEPWRGLWRATPPNPASRLALGKAIAEAIKTASDQSAAFMDKETKWIRGHIVVGTSRSDLYAMLRSQGLVAFNPAVAPMQLIASKCVPSMEQFQRSLAGAQ